MRGKESLRLGSSLHNIPLRKPRFVEVGYVQDFRLGKGKATLTARRSERPKGSTSEHVIVERRPTQHHHAQITRIDRGGGSVTVKTRLPGLFHIFSRED